MRPSVHVAAGLFTLGLIAACGTSATPTARFPFLVGGDVWYRTPAYDAAGHAILVSLQPGERNRVIVPLPMERVTFA